MQTDICTLPHIKTPFPGRTKSTARALREIRGLLKILLYNPDNGVTRNFMPHLWMFLLQSLTPAGHEVVLIDGNAQPMDEAGIARAAIESLAENFSDGVVAPILWMVIAGLPGAALYKAVNTADSMIGHRTPRYAAFGWAAARLDDLVNLPASRLSALLLVAAAAFDREASAGAAWRSVWRDAAHHRSPNAGYPEAAMAGALGLSLGGPRTYDGERIEDAAMGNGRWDASAADIRRALTLYRRADAILIGLVAGLAALIFIAPL